MKPSRLIVPCFFILLTAVVIAPVFAESELISMTEHHTISFQDGLDYSSGKVFGVEENTDVMVTHAVYEGQLLIDFYYPAGTTGSEQRPAVLIVNGAQSDKKNRSEIGRPYMRTNQVLGWGQLIAEKGLVAVAYETGNSPEESLVTVTDWLQKNGGRYGVDTSRIGFWACSNSCIAAIKAIRSKNTDFEGRRPLFEVLLYGDMMAYSDVDPDVPLFVVKAAKDVWADGSLIDRFVNKMRDRGAQVEYFVHPGDHAFDCRGIDPLPETLEIIEASLEFMRSAAE